MIEISELKFSYPTGGFHLDVESLSIESGSAAAVIGQSGTGKTTLLNLISGVVSLIQWLSRVSALFLTPAALKSTDENPAEGASSVQRPLMRVART